MANKKGPLTKSEIFYIQNNPEGKTLEQLSKEMKRSLTQISKVKPLEKEATGHVTEATQEDAGFSIKDMMNPGQNNVTVMSQAVSERMDESRSVRNRKKKEIDTGMVHQPFGE